MEPLRTLGSFPFRAALRDIHPREIDGVADTRVQSGFAPKSIASWVGAGCPAPGLDSALVQPGKSMTENADTASALTFNSRDWPRDAP